MQTGRSEKRSAAAVAVMLTSQELVSKTEFTFTQNISCGGARVVTKKIWAVNNSLVIKSFEGDLQSEATVVYCQPLREKVYGIGVKLIEPKGCWQNEVLTEDFMDSPLDLLEELLEAIARTLVDHPEEVQVCAVQGRAITILELRVHPEDIGQVIGQDGRIAKALRTILGAAGGRLNQRVRVEILD